MVTDFRDGVVVGHIGGVVARLVDGHASELLDGAVQLEPALINWRRKFELFLSMFYPFIQVNIELKAVSNFPSSFVMARFYKYDKIC